MLKSIFLFLINKNKAELCLLRWVFCSDIFFKNHLTDSNKKYFQKWKIILKIFFKICFHLPT